MKICLLNHGLANGGTDSFVLTLATGLVKSGHDVTIAMAVDPDSKPQFWEAEARNRNINIQKLSDLGGEAEPFVLLNACIAISRTKILMFSMQTWTCSME